MNLPSPSPEQNAAVAARYDGEDLPFSALEMDATNRGDLRKWVENNELVALVDESCGGIIGYVNRAHADRIAALLNVATL